MLAIHDIFPAVDSAAKNHLVCYKPADYWVLHLRVSPPTARKLKQQPITDILYSAVTFDSTKHLKLPKGTQEIRDSEQVKKAVLAKASCLQ